jgi:hypothetical protein
LKQWSRSYDLGVLEGNTISWMLQLRTPIYETTIFDPIALLKSFPNTVAKRTRMVVFVPFYLLWDKFSFAHKSVHIFSSRRVISEQRPYQWQVLRRKKNASISSGCYSTGNEAYFPRQFVNGWEKNTSLLFRLFAKRGNEGPLRSWVAWTWTAYSIYGVFFQRSRPEPPVAMKIMTSGMGKGQSGGK